MNRKPNHSWTVLEAALALALVFFLSAVIAKASANRPGAVHPAHAQR